MPFTPPDSDFVGSISEIAIHYGVDDQPNTSGGPTITEDEAPTVPHYLLSGEREDGESGLEYGNGYLRVAPAPLGRGIWQLNWQGLTLAEKDELVAFLQAHQETTFALELPETAPALTNVVARNPEVFNISYDAFQVQAEAIEIFEQPVLGLPETDEILLFLDTRESNYAMGVAPRIESRADVAGKGVVRFEQTADVEEQPSKVLVSGRYWSRHNHNDWLSGEHGDFLRTLLDGRGGWSLFLELANFDLNNISEHDDPGGAGETIFYLPIGDVSAVAVAGIWVRVREDDTTGALHIDVSVRARKTDGDNWIETSFLTGLNTGPNILSVVCDFATPGLKIYWNGVEKADATPTFGASTWLSESAPDVDRLGADNNSTGFIQDIGRVVLYGVALSSSNRAQVESHFGY